MLGDLHPWLHPWRHWWACCEELFAQARLLCLVPVKGILDVGGSRRPDDDPLHRRRLRIRLGTSSQGMPTGPSASSSSSRRSSSAHCASVIRIASGVAARLSQSASRRLRRSCGVHRCDVLNRGCSWPLHGPHRRPSAMEGAGFGGAGNVPTDQGGNGPDQVLAAVPRNRAHPSHRPPCTKPWAKRRDQGLHSC